MKKKSLLIPLCALAIFLSGLRFGLAQDRGPVVNILGKPETPPPDAHVSVSVIDPHTGHIIEELSTSNFSVQVSGQDTEATVSLETNGVAVVMVIDRGGIAKQADPRIGQAVELADSLLNMLNVDGSASADMVALIGIRGEQGGGLTPLVDLTDYDPNAVRNEFDKLRTEIVDEVTPLYDGIDRAIAWITENDDAQMQEKLARRRPIIVVFSDGIDNQFSSESYETIIINKCLQNNILLYAIRMEAPGRTTDADNLEALASQTNGLYISHTEETRDQVQSLFSNIVTQRQAYRVTFPLYRPQGDYQATIRVLDTPLGDGSDETTVSSQLQLPEIALAAPANNERYTIPYSETIRGFEPAYVTLRAQVTAVDGAERNPTEIRYFANGVLIGSGDVPPNFEFVWDVSAVTTATQNVQSQAFTLIAETDDAYLDGKMTSRPVNINVTWEKLPPTPTPAITERVEEQVRTNWWMILVLVALLAGLLLLFIMLLRTRGEMARKVATRTTGVLKGVTRRLGATPQRAPGKLVVIQGANMGKEFRLSAHVVKVGRDPQFCDFALYDEYTSNPHFSVQLEQTQFYITDEGSTNGTRVNDMPIPRQQRVLLQPDAIIQAGQTRLQFKRLGGTTRHLSGQPEASSSPPGQVQPPTQPARPSEAIQGPPQSDPYQEGGPTRPV